MYPDDIKVTLLVVLSEKDLSVFELLFTGAYKIIKTIPGTLDPEHGLFFKDAINMKVEEAGYIYMLYQVDSPAYPHPLYFAGTDSQGVYPGAPVTFLPQ